MDLGNDADPVLLQALDDPHLPKRAGTVKLRARDLTCELGQLAAPTRRGRTDAPNVVVQIEIRVLNPDRMVQTEGHLGEASMK